MIVVIVHHWCKPNMEDTARVRIDRSGKAMESAPGFQYRYRIETAQDTTQISTMTAWTDEQSYRAFRAGRPPASANDPSVPYDRVVAEVFTVKNTHGHAPA